MRRVCVFCGSSLGDRAVYADSARVLGRELASRGLGLVFGGGHIGVMGVLADAALAGGGEVIGVIPQSMVDRELAHQGLTELRVVRTMHERKALMADLSDGFIALAGGFGTADELMEILTWAQLGLHDKPIALLNVAGYFDPLLEWLDRAVDEGFIRPYHRDLLRHAESVEELLQVLTSGSNRPREPKALTDEER